MEISRRAFDLRRHVVFEYYPRYTTSPYRHWDQDDRHPPIDLAANNNGPPRRV